MTNTSVAAKAGEVDLATSKKIKQKTYFEKKL